MEVLGTAVGMVYCYYAMVVYLCTKGPISGCPNAAIFIIQAVNSRVYNAAHHPIIISDFHRRMARLCRVGPISAYRANILVYFIGMVATVIGNNRRFAVMAMFILAITIFHSVIIDYLHLISLAFGLKVSSYSDGRVKGSISQRYLSSTVEKQK